MLLGAFLDELLVGVFGRPSRSAPCAIAVGIGVACFVGAVGVSQSAAQHVSSILDRREATTGVVTSSADAAIPWGSAAAVSRLGGVIKAGEVADLGFKPVRSTQALDPAGLTEFVAPLAAVGPGFTLANSVKVVRGRAFDDGNDARTDDVAMVGAKLAKQLRLADLRSEPRVTLDGRPYLVIGVVEGGRYRDVSNDLLIPGSNASTVFGAEKAQSVVVHAAAGELAPVLRRSVELLRLLGSGEVRRQAVPDSGDLREELGTGLNTLMLALASVTGALAVIGIATVSTMSVSERTEEIGLRRALGASRSQILRLFLGEAGLLGLAGGIFGSAMGTGFLIAVCTANGWTAVLDPWFLGLAVVAGLLVGIVAGLYPAVRGSLIEPAVAIRSP